MTLEEFEIAVRGLFGEVAPMTLATCSGDAPWATDVYFAPCGLDLVFFSSAESRHCRNLAANPSCAATVHAPAPTWRDIRGVQMEGVAGPAASVGGKAEAFIAYVKKFPFAHELLANPTEVTRKLFTASPHVFRPSRIRYLDNRLGIGVRFSLLVNDGKPTGPPERENI